MMKKFAAVLLAVVLGTSVFSVFADVSADGTNFLKGKSYTVTFYDAEGNVTENPDTASKTFKDTVPPSLLTDGAYRGDGSHDWNELNAVKGVSLEYLGSNTKTEVAFEFGSPVSLGEVVIRRVRGFFLDNSVNRFARVAGIRVSTDGTNYNDVAFIDRYDAVADAPEYKTEDDKTGPQFFDLTATITGGAANIKGLKILLDTKFPANVPRTATNPATNAPYESGYILQLDEIEAYTVGAPVTPPESSEVSEAPKPPETSKAPVVPPPSPPTGDAGLALFAALAALSLAGVVMARKKK